MESSWSVRGLVGFQVLASVSPPPISSLLLCLRAPFLTEIHRGVLDASETSPGSHAQASLQPTLGGIWREKATGPAISARESAPERKDGEVSYQTCLPLALPVSVALPTIFEFGEREVSVQGVWRGR